MYHNAGEIVRFEAQRRASIRYISYIKGDIIKVTLRRDWDEDEGLGEGGPWGWGGYTSRKIDEIGGLIQDA